MFIFEEYSFPGWFYPVMLAGISMWSIMFTVLVSLIDATFDKDFLNNIDIRNNDF